MKKYKFTNLLIIIFIILSCNESLLIDLSRNAIIPDGETVPEVKNYTISDSILLKWNADPGADEYIVYKDVYPAGNFSEIIYRGTALQFIDTRVINNTFYYYKLAKRRGQKIFVKSKHAMGLSSSFIKDNFEDNNFIEKSSNIDKLIGIDANLYFARNIVNVNGNIYIDTISDTDYYTLLIDPRRRHIFQITFKNANVSSNIIKVFANNSYKELTNQGQFNVENQLNTTARYYIKIEIDTDNILGTPSATGNREEAYLMHLVGIEPIDPQ